MEQKWQSNPDLNIKELYNNNDCMEKKDLVDNLGQEEE